MNDTAQSDLTPAERVDDIPRTLRALRTAVREALRVHKLAGNPVAIWRETGQSAGPHLHPRSHQR